MKNRLLVFTIFTATLVMGCASADKRISQNQDLFDTYGVRTQSLIRQGSISIGFNPTQVQMALGEPDRIATIQTESGTQTVWHYFKRSPSVGLSLGAGTVLGGSSSVGTGIGIGTDSSSLKLEKSVVFDRETGNVSAIETFD